MPQWGLALPRRDDDELLARTASDGRVVIHTSQTGGVKGQRGSKMADHWSEMSKRRGAA